MCPCQYSDIYYGETGTGKELVARAYLESPRKSQPFIAMNYANLTDNLLSPSCLVTGGAFRPQMNSQVFAPPPGRALFFSMR